jgi:hypothetical protein
MLLLFDHTTPPTSLLLLHAMSRLISTQPTHIKTHASQHGTHHTSYITRHTSHVTRHQYVTHHNIVPDIDGVIPHMIAPDAAV